jgi:uroporphyrinogen decarboxylase
MTHLSGKEVVSNILDKRIVNRTAIFEHFWDEIYAQWPQQGYIPQGVSLTEHFNLDISPGGIWPEMAADVDFEPEVIDETDTWVIKRDGNGATLKHMKHSSSTPEHIDFTVKDRTAWEKLIKPKLLDEDMLMRRIPFEEYRLEKQVMAKAGRFFCWMSVNVFECMHPICGHEYMLMGMALDPDWVKDMCEIYSDLLIKIQEILFEREGVPDGIWYYEDMGFKGKPFMSPAMYDEIIKPSHKKTIDYAHSIDRKVIMHSCGYIEPLLPSMINAGIDCLQPIEVKAGMNLLKLQKKFGDRIAFMGGLDARVFETNDLSQVDNLIENVLKPAIKAGGYIVHSDHGISSAVEYETYKYFIDKAKGIKI